MSATNRSDARRPDDFYETPGWCVRRLLDRVKLPGVEWLEPAAGKGAIIRAVNASRGMLPKWTAVDLRPETKPHLTDLVDGVDVYAGIDFLRGDFGGCNFDVVITNPPFSLAMEFIEEALLLAPYVVLLLRLNFLGAGKRAGFFAGEMPDVYVLPNRPSFTGGGTDATEYAWFVWTPERGRKSGSISILDETPALARGRAAEGT